LIFKFEGPGNGAKKIDVSLTDQREEIA
jgi:hypothetical protein